MKKPVKREEQGPLPVRVASWPAKESPLVWEYLTARKFDDGTSRQTATITFFLADDGGWGATLKDREGERALFGRGNTFEEVLESLESQLEADAPPWRADKLTTGSSARIRK